MHPGPTCAKRDGEKTGQGEKMPRSTLFPSLDLPVEVNSPPLNLSSWGFGSAVGTPFQLRRGHLSLSLGSAPRLWGYIGGSPWNSGLSRPPPPSLGVGGRTGGGAGSGRVVTAPAGPGPAGGAPRDRGERHAPGTALAPPPAGARSRPGEACAASAASQRGRRMDAGGGIRA